MNVIKGQTFENEDVDIDYTKYEDCTFKNSNIIVQDGIFGLKNCDFDSCKLTMLGRAKNIILLAKLFFPDIPIVDMKLERDDEPRDLESWR